MGNCLPMQGTLAQSLVQKDTICHGAVGPMRPNPQSPCALEPTLHNRRSHHNEKPEHCNGRKTACSNADSAWSEINEHFKKKRRMMSSS